MRTLVPVLARKKYVNIYYDMKKLEQLNKCFPIQYKQKLSKYQMELAKHKEDLDYFTNRMSVYKRRITLDKPPTQDQ